MDVSAFDESDFSKTAAKCLETLREEFRGRAAEKPDYWARLLRTRRQWPHSRAAEKGDELAPSHRHPTIQDSYRSGSNLHRGAPPMSALGHKRTYAVQNGMSALPLKADIQAQPLSANSGHRPLQGWIAKLQIL